MRTGANTPSKIFLGFTEEMEIYKPSIMTDPRFAHLFQLTTICPQKQKLW